ncbi:hypothetical protein ACIPQJ_16645 [Streptomyces sp. NPDC090082]
MTVSAHPSADAPRTGAAVTGRPGRRGASGPRRPRSAPTPSGASPSP